jgi:hypothetical protein
LFAFWPDAGEGSLVNRLGVALHLGERDVSSDRGDFVRRTPGFR